MLFNNGEDILPAAYGADLGVILKPVPKMLIWTPVYYDSFNDTATSGILLVYIGSYVIVYGGVIAILVGLSLWQFKKTLPDGNRVYRFLPVDRNHGKIILFLGLMAAISLVISSFYNSNTGNLIHELFG